MPPGVTGAFSAPSPWRSACGGRVLWGQGSVVVAPGTPTSGGRSLAVVGAELTLLSETRGAVQELETGHELARP